MIWWKGCLDEVRTRCADRRRGTSRALGLQPRGIEGLERLGALNSLPERALQVERIVVHINGKRAASVRVGQRTALVTRPGLVISQAEVEAALRRRVAELGGEIEWSREAVAGLDLRVARGGQRVRGVSASRARRVAADGADRRRGSHLGPGGARRGRPGAGGTDRLRSR